MSDPNLTKAVEAAARAMSAHWRDMSTNMSLDRQRMLARHALTAAAPLVEAQVRETIADAIKAERDREWATLKASGAADSPEYRFTMIGYDRSEWIARGGVTDDH